MALKNLIKQSTATTGTGDITLGAAVTGYNALGSGDDGKTFTFVLIDGNSREMSRGVYTHSGPTITRTLLSSTTGSLLNLSGTAVFGVTPAAEDLVATTANGFNQAALVNGTLSASVSGNALTIAVKTLAGADPSTNDPVLIAFRSATATSGTYVLREITGALSVTVPSGQAVGTSNNVPFRFWVNAIDNSGTVELAVINCVVGGSSPTQIYPLAEQSLISTTAIATAPNAAVFYSTAARSNKAYRVIGFVEYSSGLATAGTYGSAPSIAQLFGPGVKKPGDVVQTAFNSTLTPTQTTSNTFQSTSSAVTLTPTSAANLMSIRTLGGATTNGTGTGAYVQIHRGSTALGAPSIVYSNSSLTIGSSGLDVLDAPGTTSSTTYTAKLKNTDGATTVGYPRSGNVEGATMFVQELMA